ncbi:MAG TPA: hypothetical protein EYP56_22115, partial [Planctomycetaceae bacterium]|nr:hypothetical protein [Planctomycetaceae bacterium]
TVGAAPRWSPDGKRLLLMREKSKRPDVKLRVYVIDRDGKNERWICEGPRPDWSPNGKRIALCHVAPLSRIPLIRIVDLGTGQQEVIGYGFYRADWSPDGKAVVANGFSKQRHVAMVRLRVDVPFEPEFLVPEIDIALSPSISSDGKYMVFVAQRPKDAENQAAASQ